MTNDEIIVKMQKLANNQIPNGNFHLLRIYGAYEREKANNAQMDLFRSLCDNSIVDDITIISDTDAIAKVRVCNNTYYKPISTLRNTNILCESFDEALIRLVCLKRNCESATLYIMKMIGD